MRSNQVKKRGVRQDLAAHGLHGLPCSSWTIMPGSSPLAWPCSWGDRARCPFYLQQKAGHYVPSSALKPPIATDIRTVFDAPGEAWAVLSE